jgi:hypothetical protein
MTYINNNAQINIKFWKLVVVLIIVNISGLILRYFGINTYIILIGFRFHLSFVLPFVLTFNIGFLPYIKKSILRPDYRNVRIFLYLILLPLLIEAGLLFFLQKIDLGDPEYFYEFGISSIADFPIYLIWNFPQLILIFFFLTSAATVTKFKFLAIAAIIFLLFAFELVPFQKIDFSYWDLDILISCSIISSVIINYYRNVYWFGITLFTSFWLGFLAFGSNSKQIVNILFASQYRSWEGFFEVAKEYRQILLPCYFGIALILSVIAVMISYKRIKISAHKI